MEKVKIGILTSSDRASRKEYEDISGPAIRGYFSGYLNNPLDFSYRLIPDERASITETLIELCDKESCDIVCTTGGTGPAPRDVTPEAMADVLEKELPGFGEAMRKESLQFVPTAILSRQTAGIRGKTLIINLPGKPKAIAECLDAVIEAIPTCIDLIEGPRIEFKPEKGKAFRPGK